ncbi:uncharacterized protein PAC_04851 [Phialocephala subalpina]|uniref:Uncharacterized protein n=1 Tax=Phialocephala subalpina TaxID=576137 RepID=A0A1L7WQD0_9HELO|nr:uncharacterized protein PAC_04851 [Phialocephala subalpina]
MEVAIRQELLYEAWFGSAARARASGGIDAFQTQLAASARTKNISTNPWALLTISHSGAKKRSTTRILTAVNSDELYTRPGGSLGTVVAVKRAPTAARPWPLDTPAQHAGIKKEEEEPPLAQIAPPAAPEAIDATKDTVYQVLKDSQELWGSKRSRRLGVYSTIPDANSRVLDSWHEVCDQFHLHARNGSENDERLWWEVNRSNIGRFWVRIEELNIESHDRRPENGWGHLPPANHRLHWDGVKSLENEQVGAMRAQVKGFAGLMAKNETFRG